MGHVSMDVVYFKYGRKVTNFEFSIACLSGSTISCQTFFCAKVHFQFMCQEEQGIYLWTWCTSCMEEELLISSLALLAYQAVLSVVGLLSVLRCTQWTVNIFYI